MLFSHQLFEWVAVFENLDKRVEGVCAKLGTMATQMHSVLSTPCIYFYLPSA